MFQARPYQEKFVRDASNLLWQHPSVCGVMPTGSGKTCIAALISLQLAAEGNSCLFLVHRRELISQTYKTLCNVGLGSHVGIIANGYPLTPWAPMQIGMVTTLVNRLDYAWLKPRILFIDECHHVRAATWERILAAYPKAYRFGLTATPQRLDGKGLKPYFEVILEGPTIGWLSTHGYLADSETFYVSPGDLYSGLKKTAGGDYSPKQMDSLVDGPMIANVMRNINLYARGRRSLFYALSIKHSREVVEQCNEQGIPAEHVDGNTPEHQRDATLQRFAEGRTHLVSNVGLFSEGLDVPECDTVIHGRPTASMVFYRQANGRMFRPKVDGRKGRCVDLVGNVERHGFPEEEIEWTLEGGAEAESVKKARQNVRVCAECNYGYPAYRSACPLCGHERTFKMPVEVEAELIEARNAKREQKKRRGEMSRELNSKVYHTMGDMDKLLSLQREYGRKPGIIYKWLEIYKPMWGRERDKAGFFG